MAGRTNPFARPTGASFGQQAAGASVVTLEVDVSDALKEIEEVRKRLRNTKPAFDVIKVMLLQSTDANFAQGGRREGVPNSWPPLSPATIERRPKGQQANPRILIVRGRAGGLLGSITGRSKHNEAQAGTNKEYAPIHQQGGRWGDSKRITGIIRIPSHTRRMRVRTKATQPVQPAAIAAERRRERSGEKRRKQRDNKREGRERKAKAPIRLTDRARKASLKAKRGPLRKVRVRVRAYSYRQSIVIPARPFLGVSKAEETLYGKQLETYIIVGSTIPVGSVLTPGITGGTEA